jgi:general secretion pathway protein D
VQYKDIGIILKVKPQINESGLVALEINQEVSTYTTQTLYTNSTQIILNKTEATTNVVVSDGQTIVIGGLIREDTTKSDSGIPFLHRIPVLGYLFGEKTRDTNRREMVILLTPHVIKTQGDARKVTDKYIDKFSDLGTVKKEDIDKVGAGSQDRQKNEK